MHTNTAMKEFCPMYATWSTHTYCSFFNLKTCIFTRMKNISSCSWLCSSTGLCKCYCCCICSWLFKCCIQCFSSRLCCSRASAEAQDYAHINHMHNNTPMKEFCPMYITWSTHTYCSFSIWKHASLLEWRTLNFLF